MANPGVLLITARNEVGQGNVLTPVCHSIHIIIIHIILYYIILLFHPPDSCKNDACPQIGNRVHLYLWTSVEDLLLL